MTNTQPPSLRSGTVADPIKSDLDDESLRSFLNAYISDLPSKVAELQACLDRGDAGELSSRLHNLKGTGGLYGLMPITIAAEKAEALIHGKAAAAAIESQIRELIEIIERVEGFNPGNHFTRHAGIPPASPGHPPHAASGQ